MKTEFFGSGKNHHRALRGNREIKVKKNEGKKFFGKMEWLGIFLTIASIVSTLLALVGYGVAISIDNIFGISHETLFSSSFELIELSVWGITIIFIDLSENFFWEIYRTTFYGILPVVVIFLVIVLLGTVILKNKKSILIVKKLNFRKFINLFKNPDPHDSTGILFFKWIFYSLIFLITSPLIFILIILFVIYFTSVFSTVSIMGMAAGERHIKQYVIGPDSCTPLRSKEQHLAIKKRQAGKLVDYAKCVTVSTYRGIHESGRVVFATSSAIVLFNPITGSVRRVPIKDAIIEVVDKL